MRAYYRTSRRTGVNLGIGSILLLVPFLMALLYAGVIAAVLVFFVLGCIAAIRSRGRHSGLLIATVALVAVGYVGVTTANGATPKTYALGHAKTCKVGYSKATRVHVVQVGSARLDKRYVACVPKPIAKTTTAKTATTSKALGAFDEPVGVTGATGATGTTGAVGNSGTDETTTTIAPVRVNLAGVLDKPSERQTFDNVITYTRTFSDDVTHSIPTPEDPSASIGTVTVHITTVSPVYFPLGTRTLTTQLVTCTDVTVMPGNTFACPLVSVSFPAVPWMLTITYSGATYTDTAGEIVTLAPQTATWEYALVGGTAEMIAQ